MIDQIIANNTTSGTQFIDLGLPSGTLWADRNIGAGAPEDYGDHFRWGETAPFTENSDDYEYRDLGENIAGTEYDVATSMLGKGYQMPTDEQLKELKHYCTWEQSTINDVYGMKVTGPNGNSIFLPAAGFRYNISSSLASVGKGGYYWIATHDNLTCGKKRGNYLMFNSIFCSMALYDRAGGSSVRPVMTVNQVSNKKEIQLVDLGLLSGTLWADRNIGADYPENYGYHFRWGETSSFVGSSGIYKCRDLGENIAGTEYDAATSILGKGYQMPTHEQQKELVDCCTWEWSTVYGFKGMRVTGPNGNSIFLPAAGYRDYHSCSLDYVGLKGCYWSATPVFTGDGHYLEFDSGNQSCYGNSRFHGFTVRPVSAEFSPKKRNFEAGLLTDNPEMFETAIEQPRLHKKTFQELTTEELYELLRVRSEVFVVEQNCVYQDMDNDDQESIHLWLTLEDRIVALARVCPAGTHMKEISIGRVITTERGKGYGKQIMLHSIEAAVKHFCATLIDIEAQEYAKGFYESVGFKQSSDVFMLDGIPHIKMTWTKER